MAQEATQGVASNVEDTASSPTTEGGNVAHNVVSLDSGTRVQPIHPSIPEIRLPGVLIGAGSDDDRPKAPPNVQSNVATPASTTMNPLTLQPFSVDELRSQNIEGLLRQFQTPEAARNAREDVAKELRKLLDENERKTKEIDREMEEKEKTREIERKVYARKLGKDG